eukprot:6210222-Pleurochrysis_carterae.AAC.2
MGVSARARLVERDGVLEPVVAQRGDELWDGGAIWQDDERTIGRRLLQGRAQHQQRRLRTRARTHSHATQRHAALTHDTHTHAHAHAHTRTHTKPRRPPHDTRAHAMHAHARTHARTHARSHARTHMARPPNNPTEVCNHTRASRRAHGAPAVFR